ncbi:hypothetical protein [Pseudoalteromonas phenolica]|uniref:hypothetical protein n=1 Tax=Pseudoalteromonas phenolica TaxID=161398 RepID=UPI00110AC6D4|nr:hypothetical protein [Pseudoalteromonas phenolica]TMO57119.1 hypothetical protein CWC21_04330 [Pseudoalteromonas phenolica]
MSNIECFKTYKYPPVNNEITATKKQNMYYLQNKEYFLTAAGESLNQVISQKHYYEPYADVSRHVLDKMKWHFISDYADGLNKPETPIEIKENSLMKH